MEGLGGITAKREKNPTKSSTSFQEKKKKKEKKDYYVWICLNKGRDGFVALTKACHWAKKRDFIIIFFFFF